MKNPIRPVWAVRMHKAKRRERSYLQSGMAWKERALSPRDAQALIDDDPEMADMLNVGAYLKDDEPVDFVSEHINEELIYFRSAAGGKKRLLVCFSDRFFGMFLSVPTFLQVLGTENYDVLMVHDRRQALFDRGFEGITSGFRESITYIADWARPKGYDEVYTCGASMGGIPALRAGMLLNATRATSICGSFRDDKWWYRKGGKFTDLFDPLCNCPTSGATKLAAFYGTTSFDDRENARALALRRPDTDFVRCRAKKHNIFLDLTAAGTVKPFIDLVMAPDYQPNPNDYDQFL